MKFSIIMPVYNKAPHLGKSIASVLNQSYKDFELIIVDDASTDGSSNILASFDDDRIKVFRREISGPGGYAARNLGIKAATADWVSFLDADDTWDINYLECIMETVHLFPLNEIISTNWDNIYSDKTVMNAYFENIQAEHVSFTLADFFRQNYFVWTSAVTIKKTLIIKAGLFPEGRCKRGGDMDAWIRCLYLSKGNIWVNKKLAHYHRETVNSVTDNVTNPVEEICSMKSIEMIRHQTEDKKLLKAIDCFLTKVVYYKMVNNYRRGAVYSSKDLKLIKSKFARLRVAMKYRLRTLILERKP